MAVHGFFLLLLVAKSMAVWDSNSEIRSWKAPGQARAVPIQCTQRGVFCSTCHETYFCVSATATPIVEACPSDRLCGGNPGFAGCTLFMGEGVSAGDCDCDTIGNVGYLADPYDATRYFICIQPEGQFLITCADGLIFNSEANACEEGTATGEIIQKDSDVDCSTNSLGFYTNDPTCETYTVCYSSSLPGILGRCSTGEAFDTSVSGCVTQCSLAPSVFACPEGGSGAFPDTSDCSIFHVCDNGAIFASNLPCPSGQLFEPTSMACVATSTNVVCPVINACWAAYCDACGGICPDTNTTTVITITTPDSIPISSSTPAVTPTADGGSGNPNCNNNTGYHAYTADCKQFWSCQDDDAGGYETILYRCPGDLYFIPSMRHCSFQSDLPTNPGCTIVP